MFGRQGSRACFDKLSMSGSCKVPNTQTPLSLSLSKAARNP